MTLPAFFVDCDVGKTEIVVFSSRDQTTTTIANEPASLARFASSLEPGGLVVCEQQADMKPRCSMRWLPPIIPYTAPMCAR